MFLDPCDRPLVHRLLFGGNTECAVGHMAPGAPGNLADLGCGELPHAPAVEFAERRERDMVDIHVQAHADSVCGDQVVDLARLVHADLGVACPGAQRAQNHRSAAALPADEFGQAVNLARGECDHCGAWRQPCHLAVARVIEPGEAGPVLDHRLGGQLAQ